MIAYLKDQDVSIEVPDDISDGDLRDIQSNFSHYTPEQVAVRSPEEIQAAGEISEWKPNFFENYIAPVLADIGVSGFHLPRGETSRTDAFLGKAVEEYTFGLAKPATDVFAENYKDHPVYAALGQITGGVGSLLTTGGVLRMTKLPKYAMAAGQAATKISEAAPRFIAPAIMSGSTFGTNTFIKKTVEAFQEGGVDIADFGASVVKDTALGALMGGISGIANVPTAITSASGLGFIAAKIEGADDVEALLNGAIWGVFEAVGSFGREAKLRKQALYTLSESIQDYAKARNPNVGDDIGAAIVLREAEKVGGIEKIVGSDKEGTLQFIEKLNQKVREKIRVPASEPPPAKAIGAPAETGLPPSPAAGLPPEVQKAITEIKIPDEMKAILPPQVSQAIEQVQAAIVPPTVPSVPEFKNTDEAMAYGQSIVGDQVKIDALIQRHQELQAEADAIKGVKGKAQEYMDLLVKKQLVRESFQTAQGTLEGEAEPPISEPPPTQTDVVKEAVKDQPKSIKDVAEETKILEPNIRRILGQGAKKGTFTRVDKGVYVLNSEGKDIAYVHTGDAIEILPKLAQEGFKSDMVFLDIPYNTAAVRGGNRGVKYNLISVEEFDKAVGALKNIVRNENTAVFYMYSQAKSGEKEMAQYNEILIKHGFKPVAKGEYTKFQKDGITRVRNMRGNVIEPEAVVLMSLSGQLEPKAPVDLEFKYVRPKGYQTEKPAEMLKRMIEMTTEEGETVLDPFAGSGVTLAEAVKAGRLAVGIEKSEEAVRDFITPRLDEALGGGESEPSGGVYRETYGSSKKGAGRQYGNEADAVASIEQTLGGLKDIKKMKGPELVKLAKSIMGDVPAIKKLLRALGFFDPNHVKIVLDAGLFSDPKLWEAVLAHEIGHLMDFKPHGTMARGNILGRIASLKHYLNSLLPEGPKSTEGILTEEDRARFMKEAQAIAKGGKPAAEDAQTLNQFDPQTILDVWNKATGDIDKALSDYIKGLNTEDKKAIIKAAMQAQKKGEKVEIKDINKFNKQATADPQRVADIYKDLIQKEIKKRNLWQKEVITKELKALTQYWKPFDDKVSPGFTAYRYSSAELYADFISVLLNAPGKAKAIAPSAYRAFFNYFENKPEIMKTVIELQTLIQGDNADLQQSRLDDIYEMFEKGEDAFNQRQADLDASRKSIWDKFRLIFLDKNAILYDERNKLMKSQPIPPAEDAQYAIEKNSLMGAFVRSHLYDFERLVYRPAVDNDLLQPLKAILFLDRVGGDRDELANPLGFTPETALEVINHIRDTDPAKFKQLNEIADNARQWFRKVAEIPGAQDFWTKEQIFTMALNDKYAPFRVVEYMRDYVAAGFHSQMGTFQDIGDPLTSLAMKGISVATAIERNRLKKIVGNMLIKAGTKMEPAKVSNIEGKLVIEAPPSNDLGTLAWKEQGKWKAYHLDKDIADVFNRAATEKIGQLGGALNTIFANQFFRSVWITFNPTFQFINLVFYDFWRTWKNVPGLSFPKALKLYIDSIPSAVARAKGQYDPVIQEMERAGALQLTLNDLMIGQTSEDRELESVLEKFDIIEAPENKFEGVPIIEQITKILDALRFSGDAIETLSKVAGWKALDSMSEEERAYFVRNLVGTPNPKRAGTIAPVGNAIYLFSNIFKEAFRGMIEVGFKNKKTRKQYWTRTMQTTILLKLIQGAAAAGLFGIGVKDVMDKASEYHKTNYVVIPLGIDSQGNGVYITLPQDHDGRLIGGMFWKMLNRNGNLAQNLSDIFSFGADQFPGIAPMIDIALQWKRFLSGGVPRDEFRQEDILTEQERSAGGKYALEPMIRWTINETGTMRLDVHDKLSNEPTYKKVLAVTPILKRLIRVSKQGERQMAADAAQAVKKEESKESLEIRKSATEAIKKGVALDQFVEEAKTVEERQQRRRVYETLKKGLIDDAFVQGILAATSNDQKIAILKEAEKGFADKKSYGVYVDSLYNNNVISAEVASKAKEK